MAEQIYRPHLVTEPVTGLRWIARSAYQARLRWHPLAFAGTTFAAGVIVGAAGSYMGVW